MHNQCSIQRMPQERGNQLFNLHENKSITQFKSVISRRHNKNPKSNIMFAVQNVTYLLQNLNIFLSKGSNYNSHSECNEELQYYMSKQTYFAHSTYFLGVSFNSRNIPVKLVTFAYCCKSKDFRTLSGCEEVMALNTVSGWHGVCLPSSLCETVFWVSDALITYWHFGCC